MSSIPASVMIADQNDLIQYRSGDSFYRTVILLYDSFVCRSSMLATLSLLYVSTAAVLVLLYRRLDTNMSIAP